MERYGPLLSSAHPAITRFRSWSTTLDDPTTTPPPPGARGPRKPPPGLKTQIGATRDAVLALVLAHVELAKAEATAIAGEVGRVVALGAVALVVVILAALLAVIGTSLFIGEWLLGSIGWGVLHGILLFVAIAVACVLSAIGVSPRRIGRSFIVALVLGVVASIALGLDLPNLAYAEIGAALGLAVDPAIRPLVVGMLLIGFIGLLFGIYLAVTMPASGGGRFVALAGSIVGGVIIGALSAVTYGLQVGVGIGITIGYLAFIALMAADIARTGVDVEALKARFYPTATIDTSKETLEWLQKRMPPGIGS